MITKVPDGWHRSTLGEVCDAITDGTHYTPRYVSRGVPFYSVESVTRDDFTNVKYITAEEHRRLTKRCRPQRGDILMTRIGSLADTKLIDWDVDASIYVSLALLRPGRSIDRTYLHAYTKSRIFVKDVEDRSLLWAVPKKINMGDIGLVPVLVPDQLAEQRAIGAAVGESEDAVRAIERLLTKKRAIKQGMMQELLTGRTRLPGFNGEWDTMPIGQLAYVVKGQQLGRAQLDAAGAFAVWNGGIEPSGYTGRPNTTGDVVTVSEGGNSCGWVGHPDGPFWLGGHCYALSPRLRRHSVSFIYHALKARERELMALRVGSGLPNIQKGRLSEYRLSVPVDGREADAIAQILSDADAEIEALERRFEAAGAIRQGMIQELLTGRSRLVGEGAV